MTEIGRGALRRMLPRDPDEPHRVASPLELFFDLVFVVAVSFASQQLHHMEAEGHLGAGVLDYLMVFFAIWWAWMNFTWFATSFAIDDWLYRVMTLVQMAGVLVVAAGSGPAMEHHDFTLVTIGYVIMRLALVGQWVRAGISNPQLRGTALRFAVGITVVQIAWVGRLALPAEAGFVGFFILAAAEISIPIWAESRDPTPWNAHHIAERFSLFTLILLGESILASANAVVEASDAGHHIPDLLMISAAGLVIAAGMWWVYFAREQHHHITTLRSSLTFGYLHYFIFAAAGAFSAGIEVVIDTTTGDAEHGGIAAAATLSVPVAVFLAGIWWLTLRHRMTHRENALFLTGVLVVVLAVALTPILAIGVTTAGVIIAVVATELHQRPDPG